MIDRQAARRRQLQWRMRAAVLLALVLLAALTLLDELSTPDEAMLDSPQFTQPVAVRKVAAKAVHRATARTQWDEPAGEERLRANSRSNTHNTMAVSYTHLTLPTSDLV